ncbi:hypothetical protein ACFXPS_34775 [Nocardia sp. NPDC059091]|uniref:hypothetical protein n=1 Tax=unclassified Nocardia TaxID=2637762 RepID=UPI0036C12334
MAIQGFLNILLDTVHPNRGWRYCGWCEGTGAAGCSDSGSAILCTGCGGIGWLVDPPVYRR